MDLGSIIPYAPGPIPPAPADGRVRGTGAEDDAKRAENGGISGPSDTFAPASTANAAAVPATAPAEQAGDDRPRSGTARDGRPEETGVEPAPRRPDALDLINVAGGPPPEPATTTGQTTSEAPGGDPEVVEREVPESGPRGIDGQPLSQREQRRVEELRARDAEVRAHEQAHKSVGGKYAGAISYEYTTGPDGRDYATGGSVPIDAGKVNGDPDATIAKMQVVIAAALAPAQPSSQDLKVAAQARRTLAEAQSEKAKAGLQSPPPANREGSSEATGESSETTAAETTSRGARGNARQTGQAAERGQAAEAPSLAPRAYGADGGFDPVGTPADRGLGRALDLVA